MTLCEDAGLTSPQEHMEFTPLRVRGLTEQLCGTSDHTETGGRARPAVGQGEQTGLQATGCLGRKSIH